MKDSPAKFSFGKNWKDFISTISEDNIKSAQKDIKEWFGTGGFNDKSVLDVGCGSGLSSLIFYRLGAKVLTSFDSDIDSVESTRVLWEKAGRPCNWHIMQGSILDEKFMDSLNPGFDVVYSWGVLHHTGSMLKALENACKLVKKGGNLLVAIYVKGPRYEKDLLLKQRYNDSSPVVRGIIVRVELLKMMLRKVKHFKNPFIYNNGASRGMCMYHDMVDWLWGLPYEVASPDQIVEFTRKRGFVLEKIKTTPEGGCNTYLFSLP